VILKASRGISQMAVKEVVARYLGVTGSCVTRIVPEVEYKVDKVRFRDHRLSMYVPHERPHSLFARVLGGAVGATRPACDEGWAPVTLQVGQSGKVVSPKVYVGVALSGAMSHIAGCLGSKVIVAINKDKEANIFSVAHFGIVGDFKEVLPALTAKLKELKSK
jgi:hypothetical protein